MPDKHCKISSLVDAFRGQQMDAHYLAFFDCFNRQLYFEAHEVLEAIWLPQRGGPEDRFYKGLIQLAGAFVHIQKHRPGPAAALFRLAQLNLADYPARHHQLDLKRVQDLILEWLKRVECAGSDNQRILGWEIAAPRLILQE